MKPFVTTEYAQAKGLGLGLGPGLGLSLGLVLAGTFVILAASLASAQNLGLGTGTVTGTDSRGGHSSDSLEKKQNSIRQQESAPRKSQMGKRLGLLNRKGGPFDPKLFEARGRELQGQFYEIGGIAKPNAIASSPTGNTAIYSTRAKSHSRAWMYWVGAAGAVGVSAGVASVILLNKAHPPSKPQYIELSDTP